MVNTLKSIFFLSYGQFFSKGKVLWKSYSILLAEIDVTSKALSKGEVNFNQLMQI